MRAHPSLVYNAQQGTQGEMTVGVDTRQTMQQLTKTILVVDDSPAHLELRIKPIYQESPVTVSLPASPAPLSKPDLVLPLEEIAREVQRRAK